MKRNIIVSMLAITGLLIGLTVNAECVCKDECTCENNCQCKQKDAKSDIGKTFTRPWGTYTVIAEGNGYLVKTITVNPKQKLSVQRHNHRSEHWVVLNGNASIIKGKKTITLKEGDTVDIAVREIHSLQNPYDAELTILEVQKGDVIDENDIERLYDIYGRN